MSVVIRDRIEAYQQELERILSKYNLTIRDAYTFSEFSDSDKAYILKVLTAMLLAQRSEVLHLTEVFNNIVILDNRRSKNKLTIIK